MIEMEKLARQAYLYDFYGELLTEHQKQIYEDVVILDMSLREIAEEFGISRQGVHDLVRRCDKILEGYEEKLHLIERFHANREKIERICSLSDENGPEPASALREIRQISLNLLEEL